MVTSSFQPPINFRRKVILNKGKSLNFLNCYCIISKQVVLIISLRCKCQIKKRTVSPISPKYTLGQYSQGTFNQFPISDCGSDEEIFMKIHIQHKTNPYRQCFTYLCYLHAQNQKLELNIFLNYLILCSTLKQPVKISKRYFFKGLIF